MDKTKMLSILESLNFPEIGVPGHSKPNNSERVQMNIKILKEATLLSPEQLTLNIIKDLKLHHFEDKTKHIKAGNDDANYLYAIYLLYVMRGICHDVDFSSSNKDDLISERHRSLAIACIEDIVEYGLKLNLHSSFYAKESVFCRSPCIESNFYRAELIVTAFAPFVFIQSLHSSHSFQEMSLCYMAAIHSLFFALESGEYQMDASQISVLQANLLRIWTGVSKKTYYRNLMVFYAILPIEKKQKIHKDMLLKLWSSGGFIALLFAMLESKENEGKPLSQVICRLVAQPSFPAKAQQSLVKQILNFVAACSSNAELMQHMGVALVSLRELCNNRSENKSLVQAWLRQQIRQLLEIEDGCVTAMDWGQFVELISLLFQMFCTSTIECLHSELLLPYLPLLITCHMQIRLCGKHNQVCSHLSSLILNILNNRQKNEFESIIKSVALNSYPESWFNLHHKIVFEENPLCPPDLRIVQKDIEQNVFFSSNIFALALILNESSFNILSFQAFMTLFRLIPSQDLKKEPVEDFTNKNLLLTDEEREDNAIMKHLKMYELKLDLVKSLELLLHNKTLKALINENISEILKVLQEILISYSSDTYRSEKGMDDSVIMVLLVLIGEIVNGCSFSKLEEVRKAIATPLSLLEREVKSKSLKYKIMYLQKQIQGETTANVFSNVTTEADFSEARSLMEAAEPYQHVQGIEMFIRLINAKDEYILSNVHIITTLALNTLKSAESYSFLNCVRLFASLVNVNATEVLDILTDEYSSESASKDYRLVVGEALLKVCQQLGPMCYNYKALLLNCFMCGCRSPIDEFRFSSFSNLAQMCRILSYQVQNFFQELLQLIDCELTTGKYLPAKRAAVMVLSDLLEGMDNLMDYQEMLLPIYRLLKFLASSENADEKIRLHAAKGLENLSVKCKQLLTTSMERPLEKQIKIMNIGDGPKRKLKDHILYMN